MKESKDHFNIDLEFLDKKETPQAVPKKEPQIGQSFDSSTPVSSGHKYNWKNILIIGGVVLFFGWIISSSDGSSSTSPTSNSSGNDGTVVNGQYRCSSYDSSQADALDPSENKATLTLDQNALDQRSTYLDNLKSMIDNSSVNQYSSQYQIDSYNQQVDEYNTKLASYKRDFASLNTRIDRYNAQVETRNNYLTAHCTRAY